MSIVKDVRINEAEYELENGEKGKLAIFFYSGSGDSKILDHYIKIYVGNNDYYEFIDAKLDCPWIRMILSDINNMKQDSFNNFMLKMNRKKKLEKLTNAES